MADNRCTCHGSVGGGRDHGQCILAHFHAEGKGGVTGVHEDLFCAKLEVASHEFVSEVGTGGWGEVCILVIAGDISFRDEAEEHTALDDGGAVIEFPCVAHRQTCHQHAWEGRCLGDEVFEGVGDGVEGRLGEEVFLGKAPSEAEFGEDDEACALTTGHMGEVGAEGGDIFLEYGFRELYGANFEHRLVQGIPSFHPTGGFWAYIVIITDF